MVDVGFPDVAAHRQRHREFAKEFQRLRDTLERDGATPANVGKLADAVEGWVSGHVLDADRRFAEFIRARQDVAA